MDAAKLSFAAELVLCFLLLISGVFGAYKAQTQGKRRETVRDNDISQHEKGTVDHTLSVQYLPEKTDFYLGTGPLSSQVLVTKPPHIHIQPSRVFLDDTNAVTTQEVVETTVSRAGLATAIPVVDHTKESIPSLSVVTETWQASSSLSPTDATPPLEAFSEPRPSSTAAPREDVQTSWSEKTVVIVTGHTVPSHGTDPTVSVHVARLTVATSPPMKDAIHNEIQ